MDNLATIVGKNLANLRKTKGLTQSELASLIHYSDKSISKWELGYALPSVDILMDFCSFYGVTLDYLVSEKTEEEAKEALTPKEQKGDPNRPIIMGMTVIVILSPITLLLATCSTTASVSLFRLKTDRHTDAISAATPEASFTTKVCMENITLSSRLLFFNSP